MAEQSIGRGRKTFDEEKAAARRINNAALEHVVRVSLGFWLSFEAWRRHVSGIVKGPLPFFWGVAEPRDRPAVLDFQLSPREVIMNISLQARQQGRDQ